MKLTNEVAVPAPAADVFALITNVEQVAGCLPGASLNGSEGDSYNGSVAVKVGPISMTYGGTLRFLEVDEEKRRLTLKGQAADKHGGGDAEALVEVRVEETTDGSLLLLETDLVITGKIVAFGKGAITMVADRLLQQFAQNLADLIRNPAGSAEHSPSPTQSPTSTPRVSTSGTAVEALDPLSALLTPQTRVKLAIAGAFAVGMFEGWLVSRAFGRCN